MAEGGEEFGREDHDLDYMLDHDDDDDDEQEVNRTQPSQPGASSTPYHQGEQVEMQTMQHEQSGLPSYEETPLLGAQAEQEKSWEAFTSLRPQASAIDLETSYSLTKRLMVKMKGIGKKAYYLFTTEKGTSKQRLNPGLPKEILKAMGPPAEEIIAEDQDTIQEEEQRIKETQKELKQTEELIAKDQQKAQELQEVVRKRERMQAEVDAAHDKHGSNLEIEAETRRKEILIKNYLAEEKKLKKELDSVSKNVKKKEEIEATEKRQKENAEKIKRKKIICKKG